MIKDVRLAMIVAANSALKFLKLNPTANEEEIMQHVIMTLDAKGDAKIAGISAVNHILRFREKNPGASEKQIMQDLADSTGSLITNMEVSELEEESS